MSTLSLQFYTDLYTAPTDTQQLLDRQEYRKQVSAVGRLPPKVSRRPATATSRPIQGSKSEKARRSASATLGSQRKKAAAAACEGCCSLTADCRCREFRAVEHKPKPKQRPSSACSGRASLRRPDRSQSALGTNRRTVGAQGNRITKNPLQPSRKLWSRINPGHVEQPWQTTGKKTSCPK